MAVTNLMQQVTSDEKQLPSSQKAMILASCFVVFLLLLDVAAIHLATQRYATARTPYQKAMFPLYALGAAQLLAPLFVLPLRKFKAGRLVIAGCLTGAFLMALVKFLPPTVRFLVHLIRP